MKTAFSTGPGFFAANTSKVDRSILPDTVRILCARIEAYDMPCAATKDELATSFELLVAKADQDPRVARALLDLAKNIESNRHILAEAARRTT